MTQKHGDGDIAVLLSLNDVARMTSMSRGMVNKYRASGRFPPAVDLGNRRVAFVRAEVMDWIQAKIDARDAAKARKRP